MKLTEKLITEDKVDFPDWALLNAVSRRLQRPSVKNIKRSLSPPGYRYHHFIRVTSISIRFFHRRPDNLQLLIDLGSYHGPAPKTIAIMVRDDPFGTSVAEGVKTRAEEKGLEVVYYEKIPQERNRCLFDAFGDQSPEPHIVIASTLYHDAVLITSKPRI